MMVAPSTLKGGPQRREGGKNRVPGPGPVVGAGEGRGPPLTEVAKTGPQDAFGGAAERRTSIRWPTQERAVATAPG